MKAMVLKQLARLDENSAPLEIVDLPDPVPTGDQIRIKITACGVCHTELDEIEGRTPPAFFPIILGHQVVGQVDAVSERAKTFNVGDRVGVAWIYSACGQCAYCQSGQENLCPDFLAAGRDANGGYAQYMTVSEFFAHRIPERFSDSEAAPLLCAGAVGYRALKLTGLQDGQTLGLTGFGASGHLVLRMVKARYPNVDIYVFARSETERAFARELGAAWAGDIDQAPPERPNCIIDTTPVWKPVVESLARLAPGGRLMINAIRKEAVDQDELLRLDYATHLWMEKEIKSVANVTRADVREFLALAAEAGIVPEVQEFALEEANQALLELKTRKIRGAKVLRVR